jgi:S1-C subfamily serine protease
MEELASTSIEEKLGADLETLDKKKADQYDIDGGVVVKKIKDGGPFSRTRMQDGFIITSINGMDVTSLEELGRALSSLDGNSIQLEGIYPGYDGIYRYPLNLDEE